MDFMNMLSFGREFVSVDGQKYLSVQYLLNGLRLACKIGDSLPCQVYLVQEEENVSNR